MSWYGIKIKQPKEFSNNNTQEQQILLTRKDEKYDLMLCLLKRKFRKTKEVSHFCHPQVHVYPLTY